MGIVYSSPPGLAVSYAPIRAPLQMLGASGYKAQKSCLLVDGSVTEAGTRIEGSKCRCDQIYGAQMCPREALLCMTQADRANYDPISSRVVGYGKENSVNQVFYSLESTQRWGYSVTGTQYWSCGTLQMSRLWDQEEGIHTKQLRICGHIFFILYCDQQDCKHFQ